MFIFTDNLSSALVYQETESKFIYLTEREASLALDACPSHMPCVSCGQRALQEQKEELLCSHDMFSQFGLDYHIFDFVYVLSGNQDNGLFNLAQIMDIQSTRKGSAVLVTVCWLGRWDDVIVRERERSKDVIDEHWPKDEVSFLTSSGFVCTPSYYITYFQHHLFSTSELAKIDSAKVAGKFFAAHREDVENLEHWSSHDDHFYLSHFSPTLSVSSRSKLQKLAPSKFEHCSLCHDFHLSELSDEAELLSSHEPYTFMEMFSGKPFHSVYDLLS